MTAGERSDQFAVTENECRCWCQAESMRLVCTVCSRPVRQKLHVTNRMLC